jgi:uncharacterized phage-like protein YoqJ
LPEMRRIQHVSNHIKLSVTGHRPPKIGGYDRRNPIRIALREDYAQVIRELQPEECISGMALGVDQDFAEVVLAHGIRLIAAVPFPEQPNNWPWESRRHYESLLARAWEVHVISTEYTPVAMQRRNIWVVDQCTHLLAVWNGSGGGTANCIEYARKKKKPLIELEIPRITDAD